MSNSESLLQLEPFSIGAPTEFASTEAIKNAYDRARLICRHYALSVDDILHLRPKFWEFHLDNIHAESNASLVILTTQLNLCIGTLATYLPQRPDLQPLIDSLANFDLSGQFMLTEVGCGVDAANLQTTATMQPDGSFVLHTPNPQAAKFMSWTTPEEGMASGGIVFARLIVDDEDRGVRPFWVLLHDSKRMEDGVTSFALPRRAGAQAVDHAVTTFQTKYLHPEALLGSLETPSDPAAHFTQLIHRASIGTLSLSTVNVPCLKLSTYIALKYSQRRTVTSPSGHPIPILQYRTQQTPILHAAALATVFSAASTHCAHLFTTTPSAPTKSTLAITFKAAIQSATQTSLTHLATRCGAQGLFEHNAIIRNQMLMRANSIAEGDTLVTSIRLISSLSAAHLPLLDPDTPLARLAAALLAEARAAEPGERDSLCLPAAEAIGFALAYDGARARGVADDVLAVFEAGALGRDVGWCVEGLGWSRAEVRRRDGEALDRLLPRLEEVVDGWGVEAFARGVPILSEEGWEGFVRGLPRFGGEV